jgi:hypothetical protein
MVESLTDVVHYVHLVVLVPSIIKVRGQVFELRDPSLGRGQVFLGLPVIVRAAERMAVDPHAGRLTA